MKMREFRDRLLVALVATARRQGLGGFMDPLEVAEANNLVREKGQLRLAVEALDRDGLVKPSYTMGGGEDGGLDLHLTARGIEVAEDLLEEHPEYTNPASEVSAPASDRYVSLSDNQRDDVTASVSDILSAVQNANDIDEISRDIALSEIAIFESTIIQPRVPVELIDRFVNTVLSWLLKIIPKALIGAAAESLVEKLLPFLK